jgi:LysR family hydrogen peroxide-inducible transcriptional activator
MSLSGISLRDLEYIVAVADQGSFVRAAERCHVAQPSLSVQVGKVEARLGTLIFERTTRGVLVTPRGRQLVEQMREVLRGAEALIALASCPEKPFGGTLRLSAIATLGPYFFPRILQHLRSNYPRLTLVLGEGKTADLISSLTQGELDAVLASAKSGDPRLNEYPLFSEPFILACPRDHPACRSTGGGWSAVPPHERLLLEEGHCLREQALAACGEESSSRRHATSLETLKYMITAGEGCTLIPLLAANPVEGITYTTLPNDGYSRTISLMWRQSDPRNDEFHELAKLLRRIIGLTCSEVACLSPELDDRLGS